MLNINVLTDTTVNKLLRQKFNALKAQIVKVNNQAVIVIQIIDIYTINGNLVRQYVKDSDDAYLEWDLKNEYGIQISSGMYIIYIDAGELGEKTLKWFGAMRPIDLNTF